MSQQGGGAQEAMQKFGRFLSGMVMPNIGAFIAWGFLTALFIPTGWMPNEYLAQVGGPMSKWLIPLLIGYSGGAAVYGHRGGVMAAIATSGIIAGSEIPMFLGAMIMGPLGGYLIKKFDNAIRDSIPGGFEMLVNNFSLGIFGGILAMIAFAIVGPVVSGANNILRSGVEAIVAAGLLPLASIIIEPAKVLFLNNALNHGVLSPLGIQQAQEYGKSMFFLLEANPGPGFGILLAYWMFGKGMAKSSSPGAMIIHVLGGIHEIYFPYILMKPILIIAAIAGGMSGVFTLGLLGGGLIAPSSPGSIFAIIAMTPNTSALVANLSAFAVATAVSCAVASVFIKMSKDVEDDSLESAREDMAERKNRGKELPAEKKIAGKDLKVIVCHLGNGASISAVDGGRAVETSMGLTPLQGLVMGTRSGDIDPGIFKFLSDKGYSIDEIDTLLNKQSGMGGMCGHTDMRDVEAKIEAGDADARLAMDVYIHRLISYIGAYIAVLGGVDAVVFTAGIGENASLVRREASNRLRHLGLVIDEEKNEVRSKEPRVISTPDSPVTILVVPTNEELAMAQDTLRIIGA